ncbi:FlxA-like family protein [Kluyvera sp. CHPC 1.2972]|uniref:FlxA-like family protein n=1 Tax=Kluyvera sp. CHPC 1.2972 TaxID=2995176 RepID=UPI002FD830F5
MTTISSSSLPALQTTTSTAAPSGNDTAAQMARITQQIVKLTQQLKEVADGSGSTEDKQKQAEMIQEQIAMLEAQLAQLQNQQAEKAQEKQQTSAAAVTGVNQPSDGHQIDIYV